jgi:3'5'-cyclic nucleotide phosphodiesterase
MTATTVVSKSTTKHMNQYWSLLSYKLSNSLFLVVLGVPNGQLVKENAHIATLYQGKCVAEQNSIDLAWNLLMDPHYEALRECIYTNEDEFRRFRQLVVNVVLATDIFDKDLGELRKTRWSKAFSTEPCDEPEAVGNNRKATIVIEHLIQASDVSHTMQHWDIYRKWNERLFYEMQLSFKSGRTETDPAIGWYKGELWFFDNYIIPLAKNLKDCKVFGVSSEECLKYAEENRALWEVQGEKIVKEISSTDYFTRYKSGKRGRNTRRQRKKS